MNRIMVAAVAVLIFMTPLRSFAGGVIVSYENLQSVLSGYHGMPEADYWNRLDPVSTRESLMRMANDPKVFTIVRARALQAMAYYSNDDVTELLDRKAKGDKVAYIRSAALQALATAKGDQAVNALGEALKDDDVMVRLTAIRSLQAINAPEARNMLMRSLETEKNKTARHVMNRALKQME